jgi:hypothetical protein
VQHLAIVSISDLRALVEENKWENMRKSVCESRFSFLLECRLYLVDRNSDDDSLLVVCGAGHGAAPEIPKATKGGLKRRIIDGQGNNIH